MKMLSWLDLKNTWIKLEFHTIRFSVAVMRILQLTNLFKFLGLDVQIKNYFYVCSKNLLFMSTRVHKFMCVLSEPITRYLHINRLCVGNWSLKISKRCYLMSSRFSNNFIRFHLFFRKSVKVPIWLYYTTTLTVCEYIYIFICI